ncbi:NUDIX hydrolase [Pseudonocardia sp. KRD-184]|uniref:NUDIX hydrolase n=1 Tax=Pseudonocardia oceani TaxID=2792013 RepID=A0ABS6U785_9PSEU|nr:NUDIX hydrolase [Pseudonocardia oceani]MBW0091276.1 NUDIX hydrolase [Pseudonocardia oceani]MBW0098413.1 NUDIX hydrolase [Pseudonocardia oceani]MBW0110926.1 NUDIX hydrolase [Pseudonocardia oceani]MBW0124726.1 NUDIX hydrolase [Pseudonocardia oceani]MBW0127769.1 NUDIX hydrolase [Pseudonocardia oceani]
MLFPRGDGDGWTHCDQGHRHWGLYGAAGLLLRHDDQVLLQHRAHWSHHGGTWGILGGARNRGESAQDAALREASEEAGLDAAAVTTLGEFLDDHGGWTYTTVVARTDGPLLLTGLTAETLEVRWVPAEGLGGLPLHPGFAATWDVVRRMAA